MERVASEQTEEDRERIRKKKAAVEAELEYLLSATPVQRYYREAIALAKKGRARATTSTGTTRRIGVTKPTVKIQLTWDKNLTEAHRIADIYTERVKAGTEKPNPDADALVELLKTMDDEAVAAAS